jgi:hypothetical protein
MEFDHVSNMNNWLIIGALALYIALLFGCAFFGEKHASRLSTRDQTPFSIIPEASKGL